MNVENDFKVLEFKSYTLSMIFRNVNGKINTAVSGRPCDLRIKRRAQYHCATKPISYSRYHGFAWSDRSKIFWTPTWNHRIYVMWNFEKHLRKFFYRRTTSFYMSPCTRESAVTALPNLFLVSYAIILVWMWEFGEN